MRHLTALILALGLILGPPAGAAEPGPGEVYLDYHQVLKTSFSDARIWGYYTRAFREQYQERFPPHVRSKAFYIMKASAPRTVRVVSEKIDGDSAILELLPTDGERLKGTAQLRLEEDGWKLERVVWQQR